MSNRLKRKKASKKSASKCPICGEFFVGLVLHLQRSECVAVARNANVPQVPHDIAFKRAAIGNQHDEDQWELHSNDDKSFMGFNDNSEIKNAKTDKNIVIGKDDDMDENNEMYDNNSNQSVSSDDDSFHEEMDWYYVLENHDNYTKKTKKTVLGERIEEYILQGIAEEFNPSFNEDFFVSETSTAINIGYADVTSESNLFPFPVNDDDVKVGSIIDAPLSHFNFQRHFNAEEYFMIKLCNICDKANVPHHVVDDIVNLLRECEEKEIKFQASQLKTRRYFLKHLEERFKSPQPQSLVTGLEGFSNNDINYSRGLRDSAEIICYDFKEQAMDLIQDIDLWGNMDNFIGTVDPENPFSGKSPRKDGLLDEIVDGAWYRKTYDECKTIAGDENFLVLGVVMYCDKTGTDVYQCAGLEPLSFTFTIFNCECRFKSEAWHVLGYVPDLEMKSSAYKTKQRLGAKGKGRPCQNYHTCLRKIMKSYIDNQGKEEPIYLWIRIGEKGSFIRVFFHLLS